MPGVTLHFVLAHRVLARWRAPSHSPPFDVGDPVALNAFLHGAVGPNFGYLPGGDRLFSDLAHCVRTGALTTNLIRGARTATERAFAWGWLTHVLGDRAVHPWIGRGVGELSAGCRHTFVSGSADPLGHLRVELGVDCWYSSRQAEARSVRLHPVFDEVSIRFVQRAYARTYGVTLSKDALLRSHRLAGRRVGQALASLGLVGALMDESSGSLVLPGLRWLLRTAYRTVAPRRLSLAYLNPVRPAEWLLGGIDEAVAAHTDLFMSVYRSGGADIGDFNLDTGEPLAARVAGLAMLPEV